mmetsp:Transcript_55341/g.132030  ORF Transcript_55341/g.132030 Transcript_55341/m.132030 type:complete len:94 (+) Transcript_55341:38-319(+)
MLCSSVNHHTALNSWHCLAECTQLLREQGQSSIRASASGSSNQGAGGFALLAKYLSLPLRASKLFNFCSTRPPMEVRLLEPEGSARSSAGALQ